MSAIARPLKLLSVGTLGVDQQLGGVVAGQPGHDDVVSRPTELAATSKMV
jgi:hypothetical protein